MEKSFALIDYHNFHKHRIKTHPQPNRRPKFAQDTVDWVINEVTSTLTSFIKQTHQPPSTLQIRLYGGWHRGATPTDDALMVESACKKIPKRSTTLSTRFVFNLATSLLDLPQMTILDTLRARENYPRLTLTSPIDNCQSANSCGLTTMASALKKGTCSTPGCCVAISEATSVLEQKCVDILLASDLLSLARDDDNTILITEDLDLIPAVMKAQSTTKGRFTWLCDALNRQTHYSSSLTTLGVNIEPVTLARPT